MSNMERQLFKKQPLKMKVSFGLTTVIRELKGSSNRKKNKVSGMTEKLSEDDHKTAFSVTIVPMYAKGPLPNRGITYFERFGTKGNNYGELQNAADVESLEGGGFVVTDLINNKLLVFGENGHAIEEFTADDIKEPWAVAYVGKERLAVSCKRSKCVAVVSKRDDQTFRTFGHLFFKSPCGIAAMTDNRVVVTDDVTNLVTVHDLETGKLVMVIGEDHSFSSPRYVAVAANGNIIISDTGNHAVKIFNGEGNYLKGFGKYGHSNGCLKFPHGVCVDQFDNIFVADHYNNRISVFDQDGRFSCHVITAVNDLYHPQGLTLSPDLHLLVTSGDLKATNVLKYKIIVKQND